MCFLIVGDEGNTFSHGSSLRPLPGLWLFRTKQEFIEPEEAYNKGKKQTNSKQKGVPARTNQRILHLATILLLGESVILAEEK